MPPSCQFDFFPSEVGLHPFFLILGHTLSFFSALWNDEKKATLISQVVQKESEEWSSAEEQFDTPLVILNLFHCGVRNIIISKICEEIELATQKQKQFLTFLSCKHSEIKNLPF